MNKMDEIEYPQLAKRVSKYASSIGLNTNRLFRNSCEEGEEKWSLVVSRKDRLRKGALIDSPKDPRLNFVCKSITLNEMDEYHKIIDEANCEGFVKRNLAWEGYVQPTPGFLLLNPVEQVEYALHEAFHQTEKLMSLPWEEPSACITGYLGAIDFFKGTDLEDLAITHWENILKFSNQIHDIYSRLDRLYQAHRSKEEKNRVRERVFSESTKLFEDKWGSPINNAFFVYWEHFYGSVPGIYERDIVRLKDMKDVVERLIK